MKDSDIENLFMFQEQSSSEEEQKTYKNMKRIKEKTRCHF